MSRIVPALQSFEALLAHRTFIALRTNPTLRVVRRADFRSPQAHPAIPWRALDHSALMKMDEKGLVAHTLTAGDRSEI